jgi:integral membrane protein
MEKLPGALLRFRIMAWVTGVVLGALTIWLVVGYGFLDYANTEVKPDLYRWLWTAHGWLYLFYLIAGVDLCSGSSSPWSRRSLYCLRAPCRS